MMINQRLHGFLRKLSSKQNKKEDFLPSVFIYAVESLQKNNPTLLLCGSVALILSDLLPYRKVHDIDFVINRRHFDNSDLWVRTSPYPEMSDDGYESYEMKQNGIFVNLLVFDDDVKLNEKVIMSPFNTEIRCQDLNDILSWKRKYNRPKDIEDLKNIDNAFEEAIFGG